MQFQVPKFIEREPHIVWQITFRQFIFILLVAGALGVLWLTAPRLLFWLVAPIVVASVFAMVFIKIQGRPFPVVIVNFFNYTVKSKVFLWRRRSAPPKLLQPDDKPETHRDEEVDDHPTLSVLGRGRLHQTNRSIQTKGK